MATNSAVTLRILDRADKDVLKLSRTDKGAVWEFISKFRQNLHQPGLHFKQLQSDSRIYSARVSQDYRALLLRTDDRDYLLVAVRHRKDVYDNLDRYVHQINRVTGGIEVIDLTPVDDGASGDRVTSDRYTSAAHVSGSLFEHVSDKELIRLGVTEPLLGAIRKLTTDDELLALVDIAPEHTAEVLWQLHAGKTVKEVFDEVTAPLVSGDEVDPEDYAAAVLRPTSAVTTDDKALQAMLAEPFARWQVYLHPTQRALVDGSYSGPARVGGGPGTGKTIVALHRVAHLARSVAIGGNTEKPILLTTFNRNLAADLRSRLLALGGDDVLAKVDTVNVDRLAMRVVTETSSAHRRRVIDDPGAVQEWRSLLVEASEKRWDAEFMHAEWSHVILGNALTSREEYLVARRPGRGRPLDRIERDAVWRLAESYAARLEDQGVWTWRQIAALAAATEWRRANKDGAGSTHRYRHVVVDEAQDLSPAHWKMLRAMVATDGDDMFIVGDSHQRIYDNHVSLGSLGINVRGRSAKLTRCYRTTHQILTACHELLVGDTYDDLDGNAETLTGHRSLLHGERPTFRGLSSWTEEREAIVEQVRAWGAKTDGSIAIALPTHDFVADVLARLENENIAAVEIGPDGPRQPDGVHVGTMHRFKGLEYQRVIVGGISDGLVPRAAIAKYADKDPKRHQRERARDRSLFFVASTRARDGLAVFWHGTRSPFITEGLVSRKLA